MRAFLMLLALLLAGPTLAIDPEAAFKDPAMQARYEHLTQELRCLVCQNQTIADSNAPLAADLRREVRELMESGKSDEEIRTFLTARYGDFVLYRPPVTARTYLLWGAPALLLLVGVGAALVIIRRRVQAARRNPSSLEEEPENT